MTTVSKVSLDPLPGNEPATSPGVAGSTTPKRPVTAAQEARQHRQNNQLAYGVLDVLQRLNAHVNGESPLYPRSAA